MIMKGEILYPILNLSRFLISVNSIHGMFLIKFLFLFRIIKKLQDRVKDFRVGTHFRR